MRIERCDQFVWYFTNARFQRRYSQNEDWKRCPPRGLSGPTCFKGDTHKMRIESRDLIGEKVWVVGFKGDTHKMRIESSKNTRLSIAIVLFQRRYSQNEDWKYLIQSYQPFREQVSKAILTKWGLKAHLLPYPPEEITGFKGDTHKMRIESLLVWRDTTSENWFQRRYSQNEDWKVFKCFIFPVLDKRFKGDTHKMRIERLPALCTST